MDAAALNGDRCRGRRRGQAHRLLLVPDRSPDATFTFAAAATPPSSTSGPRGWRSPSCTAAPHGGPALDHRRRRGDPYRGPIQLPLRQALPATTRSHITTGTHAGEVPDDPPSRSRHGRNRRAPNQWSRRSRSRGRCPRREPEPQPVPPPEPPPEPVPEALQRELPAYSFPAPATCTATSRFLLAGRSPIYRITSQPPGRRT